MVLRSAIHSLYYTGTNLSSSRGSMPQGVKKIRQHPQHGFPLACAAAQQAYS